MDEVLCNRTRGRRIERGVGDKIVDCIGVCFVQLDDDGKIRRNEVYFDRANLVAEIRKLAPR